VLDGNAEKYKWIVTDVIATAIRALQLFIIIQATCRRCCCCICYHRLLYTTIRITLSFIKQNEDDDSISLGLFSGNSSRIRTNHYYHHHHHAFGTTRHVSCPARP
jgi:hypothetical protein